MTPNTTSKIAKRGPLLDCGIRAEVDGCKGFSASQALLESLSGVLSYKITCKSSAHCRFLLSSLLEGCSVRKIARAGIRNSPRFNLNGNPWAGQGSIIGCPPQLSVRSLPGRDSGDLTRSIVKPSAANAVASAAARCVKHSLICGLACCDNQPEHREPGGCFAQKARLMMMTESDQVALVLPLHRRTASLSSISGRKQQIMSRK